jgi:hypothetical protein
MAVCLSSQLPWEAYNKRIIIHAGLGKTQGSINKITRAKRAGGMAQAIECLPSKHKALSSNTVQSINKQTNKNPLEKGHDSYAHRAQQEWKE